MPVMVHRFLHPLLGLLLSAGTAAAAEPIDPLALTDLGAVTATRVLDDGTIALADGRTLRLAGIEVPRGSPGHDAAVAIAALIAQGPLILKSDGLAEDRYGRTVAEAFAADGTWIEGALLHQGLARVATSVDHRAAAAALYAAERGPCARRQGLWADPDYAVRRPDQAAHMIDSWQVVEGTIAAVERRHGVVDLRFGDDPARDLAIRVPGEVARGLGYDPASLAGRHVRVRGWIGKGVGPLLTLSHAEQIQLIGRPRQVAAEDTDGQ
jgi:endonuclease YncB( thermonuclease family)